MNDPEMSLPSPPTLGELTGAFARIGCLSFGGPAGQIALMHRVCVEEKRWIDEARYLHALSYCMLLPGPEAQQLATYIGWLLHGVRGGIIAGLLFVLPGLFVILGLSTIYVLYQDVHFVEGIFYGLKAAVLAIVVEALIKVARRALKTRLHRCLAVLAFLALFIFALPFPLVVLAAGLAGYVEARRSLRPAASAEPTPVSPRMDGRRSALAIAVWLLIWQAPLAILLALHGTEGLATLFLFFSKMALVTFGGAYAVLAYVAQVAVGHYHWLQPGEMVDGLALAETTPGPLVLVLSFVGYLAGYRDGVVGPIASGMLGALLAAWATFVPSFIWIFAGAPYVERLRGNRMAAGALSAITAAVVGVILNLALWFGLQVIFVRVDRIGLGLPGATLAVPDWTSLDWPALAIAALAALMIFALRQGIGRTLVACALAGLCLRVLLTP